MEKIHPIGTKCYIWISNPFRAYEGKVIDYVYTKTDKYPWYKVEYFDSTDKFKAITVIYSLDLTFEAAKEAHDRMEEIFKKFL